MFNFFLFFSVFEKINNLEIDREGLRDRHVDRDRQVGDLCSRASHLCCLFQYVVVCVYCMAVLKSCSVCSPEKGSKLDNGELKLLEERYEANIAELRGRFTKTRVK